MSQLSEYNHSTDSEKKKEDWMNAKWRPMMGWMYMCICMFDFMIAPILWSVIQALFHGGITTQWQPLTLQGAGLFHVAMGAVIGISAYGRTQEKLTGANNGGLQGMTGANGQPMGTTYQPPGGMGMNNSMQGGMNSGGYQPPMSNGMGGGFGGQQNGGFNNGSQSMGSGSTFGAPSTGFGSQSNSFPTPAFGSTTTGSFGSSGFGGAGNSAPPAFGSSPPSVLPAGVGAPPAFGTKPIGPAATAFPPL